MKLTKSERNWILYDVGNSAFILLFTTIIPIMFNSLAKGHLKDSTYLAYWGYAVTISTILTALVGPYFGALADKFSLRKRFFIVFMSLGALGCFLFPFTKSWMVFLALVIISKVGFNGSLVFYDSMLIDITSEDRMDNVSSLGFAYGYIGSVIPFVISILISVKHEALGIGMDLAMKMVFTINALWWVLFTLPLLKVYRQKYVRTEEETDKMHLIQTFEKIRGDRKIYMFLFAFLFYIDGVYTIISMATAYGTSLGLSSNGLILALLVTQLVAFPCAIYFGKISKKYETGVLIKICILAYLLISIYAIFLNNIVQFWILAVSVGMFQGAIQALSRSYYAKIIPKENSGEYFGIYDVFGKGAAIIGTLVVSLVTQATGNQHLSISTLSIMFLIGIILFFKTDKIESKN
ncbi:transporter, major facilitator family protein [Peptoniphilus duerdenii ATCC BAA-1640]|uniref:Transporter, major facilitator family protein n=1 Tax=Peptoniphilus duerdenii ATCC BAA-1640 TaxID=862517 RepID=E0NL24_9FIRM|nr:MFS transporter [Peptoniphilus duerdenii]EFM25527.1 transporter, major facilitator family protein [Peptoniphilus duerdenii ATCC BAA-1640]